MTTSAKTIGTYEQLARDQQQRWGAHGAGLNAVASLKTRHPTEGQLPNDFLVVPARRYNSDPIETIAAATETTIPAHVRLGFGPASVRLSKLGTLLASAAATTDAFEASGVVQEIVRVDDALVAVGRRGLLRGQQAVVRLDANLTGAAARYQANHQPGMVAALARDLAPFVEKITSLLNKSQDSRACSLNARHNSLQVRVRATATDEGSVRRLEDILGGDRVKRSGLRVSLDIPAGVELAAVAGPYMAPAPQPDSVEQAGEGALAEILAGALD